MDAIVRPRNRREESRIGQLATLPVFFELREKPVLVAGGGEAAAWKAELLAAAGAEVHVFADENDLSEEFRTLMRESADGDARNGACIHHDIHWCEAYFKDFILAVGDFDSLGEAQSFYEAAHDAGVPVNVIDKPVFCDFKFGSIVNRSPVVIGISTDGGAPILGQAIRRRIETLIPPALKDWAALAQALRAKVAARLEPGPQRRMFWERFSERAFRMEAPDGSTADRLLADIHRISTGLDGRIGQVTLVGAGPGDAELLTLKAVRALQSADVILFDDLVSSDVLELARREARRMLVGKRGGRTSCKQEDINNMMVDFAKSGKRVVRLKSGDPMIFGRAGEELARLQAEGIPVDVVPGITSAAALAASLGVSLTHRDHAQSVRFVTGHSRNGELPVNIDWKAIANPTETTIFYMGGRTVAKIEAALVAAGMPANTPVAVMCSITRAEEKRWVGLLSELPATIEAFGVDEPVLIGIGAVFAAAAITGAHLEHPLGRKNVPIAV
jgi:uroporphyrin-III C-methyltransferase/precorrin-2 dehydrogenase/sirohydrochlorin ferrochelatase